MIAVIICKEYDEYTDRDVLYVSHGVDMHTLETVILPCEPVHLCDWIRKDPEYGYVLIEKETK